MTIRPRALLLPLLASSLAVALLAHAAPLKTDPARSKVSAVFKQMNVPSESDFRKFSAQIDYDAAKPEASKALVEIDTASLDLGEADMNREVAAKAWFNSAQYPKATFVSSSIKPAGAGKLTVAGKLTIKGKSADVNFPLTVKQEAGKQVFEGAVPIKRLAFNIGEGEWKDTSIVADDVTIKFRISAAP
jgi:polyisoprenoid-binding protein YceI